MLTVKHDKNHETDNKTHICTTNIYPCSGGSGGSSVSRGAVNSGISSS